MKKDIIKKPLITEKTTKLMETKNVYVFNVDVKANKSQIAEAIKDLYGVTVLDVKVISIPGKLKTSWVNRRKTYESKKRKKALVKLSEKDTLKLYEGGSK